MCYASSLNHWLVDPVVTVVALEGLILGCGGCRRDCREGTGFGVDLPTRLGRGLWFQTNYLLLALDSLRRRIHGL